MVPLYRVHVKRDVSTKTPITVPAYEINLLRLIHGKENVQDDFGRVLEKMDKPVGKFQNSDNEYQRLTIKYGSAAVEKCYPSEDELSALVKKQEIKDGTTTSL